MKRLYQLGLLLLLCNCWASCNGQIKENSQTQQSNANDESQVVETGMIICFTQTVQKNLIFVYW